MSRSKRGHHEWEGTTVPGRNRNKGGESREAQSRRMREQATASASTATAEGEAQPEQQAIELPIVDQQTTIEADGSEVHTVTFASAEEAEQMAAAAPATTEAPVDDEQAIKELAAELGVSEDTVREQMAADEAAAASQAATSTEGTESTDVTEVSATDADVEPQGEVVIAEGDAPDLAMEIRLRLESGVPPAEVAADAVIVAIGQHEHREDLGGQKVEGDALEAAIAAELESLVPQLQTEAQVGEWWTSRLAPDGPARQIAHLLPPVYVADAERQVFLPLQRVPDADVEAYNQAHAAPKPSANGTNGHTAAQAPKAEDPRAGAVSIMKAILAGEELPPREDIERALASIEAWNAQEASRRSSSSSSASSGGTGGSRRLAPEDTAPTHDAEGNALPSRKLYRAKTFGPFIVGASNAAGGTVVRDTRLPVKDYKLESDMVFDKAADAKAYVEKELKKVKEADRTKFEEAAKARYGKDGTAR